MEAINISINKQSSVSINVETLQTIKQRVLQAVKQATNKHVNVGTLTLPRMYRQELKMARAISKVIDAHPTLSNICLCLMGIGIMVEIFLFA